MLLSYAGNVTPGDKTNREGHAAKVYWNSIFGNDFTRTYECAKNAALNYGYSIILSAVSREVTANGYITQLGLSHSNMFNQFNLASDLMEPFRILVDRLVKSRDINKFETEEKHIMVDVLNQTVIINNSEQYVNNAVKIYCRSIFEALNEDDPDKIRLYSIKQDKM